jgi:hypothetical protein
MRTREGRPSQQEVSAQQLSRATDQVSTTCASAHHSTPDGAPKLAVRSIIAQAVSNDDRRGRHQKPRWRYLSHAEWVRLERETSEGLHKRLAAGGFTLYVNTLYGGGAGEEYFGSVVSPTGDRIIEVDPTPGLMEAFEAETAPASGNLIATQVAAEVARLGGQAIALWSNVDRKPECPDVVVLAHMAGQHQPWVTWVNRRDDSGGLCWGHYFATCVPAWADYLERCKGYGAGAVIA